MGFIIAEINPWTNMEISDKNEIRIFAKVPLCNVNQEIPLLEQVVPEKTSVVDDIIHGKKSHEQKKLEFFSVKKEEVVGCFIPMTDLEGRKSIICRLNEHRIHHAIRVLYLKKKLQDLEKLQDDIAPKLFRERIQKLKEEVHWSGVDMAVLTIALDYLILSFEGFDRQIHDEAEAHFESIKKTFTEPVEEVKKLFPENS
jgi:hypothetical protein